MNRYTYQAFLAPEEDGAYSVWFPDLDGCYTCGNDYTDAVDMAADAAKTFIALLMKEGDPIPPARKHEIPDGEECVWVSFETSPDYIIEGPVVSAAEAARELSVSRSRITHMLNSGILEGYQNGRRTYVTQSSIDARLASPRGVGRPKKEAVSA